MKPSRYFLQFFAGIAALLAGLVAGVAVSPDSAAARPVKGALYAGQRPDDESGGLPFNPGLARAVLQVSPSGQRIVSGRAKSYVRFRDVGDLAFVGCPNRTIRVPARRGAGLKVRRDGTFRTVVRRRGLEFRLRGRFRTSYTARVVARLRYRRGGNLCDSGRVRFSVHRRGQPPFSACRSQRASDYLRGPTGRVFRQRRVVGTTFLNHAYGCLYDLNRRYELSVDEEDLTELSQVRLAGPFTAFFAQDGSLRGEFVCSARVSVVDLRSGTVGRTIDFLPCNPYNEPNPAGPVTDLELKPTGSVAWIEPSEVWAYDSVGRRRLDSGNISEKSLTLNGSSLTWVKDGVVRSATLY